MRWAAVVVAGGRGSRHGGPPKQWRPLGARSVAGHAVAAMRRAGAARILLVHHRDDLAQAGRLAGADVTLVEGGASRSDSVRAGLEALEADPPDAVLIHDAARPCASAALAERVLAALARHDGAAPALAVTDALWRGGATVDGVMPREGLWRAQTPQGFRFAPILAAHRAHGAGAADDVEVARRAGLAVAIVPGEEANVKVTLPGDLGRAARILEGRMDVRMGNGFDVHAFGEGDHVMLCGVRIDHSHGLVAHSDGDVGLHALTDAILGALALGDIGTHFPPSDERWRGAASSTFLSHVCGLAAEAGFRVSNCDVTLICEAPKVGPHAGTMRSAVGRALGIAADRVSVKATTSERLGFTGRGEGIAAIATATLVRE
jgi:2-C-methyl-D-erythritol 4-phosphate cytidylyltransferase/2-C-methyl-D-erythritol 2,4-cyclodiphosphate synthase